MGRLEGKKTVVTGGSNGIGRAIALAFAGEGADVLLTTNRDEAAAQEVLRRGTELGAGMSSLRLDGAAPDAAERLLASALESLGRVDVLVNNAATISRSRFLDIEPDEYATVLEVNLGFPFFTTQLFARHMRDEGIAGSIINVSSVSAASAISRMAHYQCSKAGLNMLTRGAAYELAEYGIRVNTLSPGLTATKANRNQWQDDPDLWRQRSAGIPLGRPGLPTDHAGAAVFLASDQAAWITGANLVVDGGSSVV